MSNNWIYKSQEELRAEALKALQKAKELETLKKQKNG
jgi:hypothetical protein